MGFSFDDATLNGGTPSLGVHPGWGVEKPSWTRYQKVLGLANFLVFAELLFVDDDELLFGCFLCCCQGGALLSRLPLQVVSGRICRDRPGCVKEKN